MVQRLLLDTHVLLWALDEDTARLGRPLTDLLTDERNDVFVSVVTALEIAIKRSVGKLEAPNDLAGAVEELGFTQLGVTFFHAEQVGVLPLHHRDPFDRILIAQAQAEGLVLVTNDANIRRYGVPTLQATT